jgi:hypothetical protein
MLNWPNRSIRSVQNHSNINISLNIACKFKCYVSKYKLVLAECDDFYFIDIAIAFIAFTLHEIFGTLGMLM